MATDATGTPTSLGIPTINPDADAPSGEAMNEQAAAIDALIVTLTAAVAACPSFGTMIALGD